MAMLEAGAFNPVDKSRSVAIRSFSPTVIISFNAMNRLLGYFLIILG